MPPAIPDRWLDYKPVGQKVEGTRFIAFKVPLKEHISNTVDDEKRLDGGILLKKIPNLGLIIDLTNTYRYYDPKFFKEEGVEYEKLMVPGHETPPKRLVDQFIMIVNEFIENNTDNEKLIGVHCTHGVNRTGYFICNYMISQMTIPPNEAMERFARARGHKIERINYIYDLNKLLTSSSTSSRNKQIMEPDNWRERKVDKHEERNDYRSRNYYREDFYRDTNSNNRYERDRTRSRPSPYYANYKRNEYFSNPQTSNYRNERNSYNRQAAVPGEEILISNHNRYQPTRVRLDYYNKRPTNGREDNRHFKRFYGRNKSNL